MGEIFWFPQVRVIRVDLDEGVPALDRGVDEDGILTIEVSSSLSEARADEVVQRIRERHKRPRLRSLSAAILAWAHHGTRSAGKNTMLATGGVLATGAMLAVVVTGSAPLQHQAGGPPVTATRSQPDLDVDPLGLAPLKPLFVHPVRVPAATKGRSVYGSRPGVPGPLVSALASTGVPVAGSHPLKPTRTMVVTSVKNALPTAVPVPSHPVRAVLAVRAEALDVLLGLRAVDSNSNSHPR